MATKPSTTKNFDWSKIRVCLFVAILLSAAVAQAQPASKLDRLKTLGQPKEKPKYQLELKKADNEIEATVAILFLAYKTFLSSQDMNSCVFSPSCSVYAMQSFQHHHPVRAYLMTFDRLTRCHPLTKKGEYPITSDYHLYDPAY